MKKRSDVNKDEEVQIISIPNNYYDVKDVGSASKDVEIEAKESIKLKESLGI